MPLDALEPFLLEPPAEVVPTPEPEVKAAKAAMHAYSYQSKHQDLDLFKAAISSLQEYHMRELEKKILGVMSPPPAYIYVDMAKVAAPVPLNYDRPSLPKLDHGDLLEVLVMLTRARALITPREKWCKGTMFEDKHGHTCNEPLAESYCSLGAIHVTARRMNNFHVKPYAISYLAKAVAPAIAGHMLGAEPSSMVAGFNDGSCHEQVLMVFDQAIGMVRHDLAMA